MWLQIWTDLDILHRGFCYGLNLSVCVGGGESERMRGEQSDQTSPSSRISGIGAPNNIQLGFMLDKGHHVHRISLLDC